MSRGDGFRPERQDLVYIRTPRSWINVGIYTPLFDEAQAGDESAVGRPTNGIMPKAGGWICGISGTK